jgi:hypothetical protein
MTVQEWAEQRQLEVPLDDLLWKGTVYFYYRPDGSSFNYRNAWCEIWDEYFVLFTINHGIIIYPRDKIQYVDIGKY